VCLDDPGRVRLTVRSGVDIDVHGIAPISVALFLAVLISLGGRWGGRATRRRLEDASTAPETISLQRRATAVYAINRSRGHGTAAVTVSIPQEIEPQDVRDAIERTVGEVDDEPRLRRMVFGGPRIEQAEIADGTTLAVRLETRPERTSEVEQRMRDRIARAVEPISPEIRVDEAA
jgi:hypothetical protein